MEGAVLVATGNRVGVGDGEDNTGQYHHLLSFMGWIGGQLPPRPAAVTVNGEYEGSFCVLCGEPKQPQRR